MFSFFTVKSPNHKLDILDQIMNKVYTVDSLEDAGVIIDVATK